MENFKNILKFLGLFLILAVAYYYENFYKPLDYDYERNKLCLFFTCFYLVNFLVILSLKRNKTKNLLSKFLFYSFWIIGFFCFGLSFLIPAKSDYMSLYFFNRYIMPLIMYLYLFEIIFHEKIQSFYPEKLAKFLNSISYRYINFMFWCLIIYYFLYFQSGLLGIIFPE